MATRRWSDLSSGQRTTLLLVGSIQVALGVAAWTDLAKRPASRVNGPKSRWAAVIAVNFVGPISYFRWGRKP
jgi:hypothetical protein